MSHPITRDHARFKKIVKGRIRNNLKKYILNGELPTPKSGGKYKIPIPSIDIPRFRFMDKKQGGVGQGDGRPGDPIEEKNAKKGKGEGGQQAGEEEGGKDLEVEVTLEELASFLGDELELPNIEPKGRKTLIRETDQYKSIRTVGPDSLKHFKRSYREALKRQIISGTYDHDNPNIIPIKGDMRYRSSTQVIEHESAAVVIYMMDVSGSMGDGQKEIVRTESFWLNLWLKSQYKNIEIRYIIHDATAKEVDEETFFKTRESGGTLISSALRLCREIMEKDYDPEDWNIYLFHFSDGDNWSTDDTKFCLQLLNDNILPAVNVFCYGQVESRYGSGQFYKDLHDSYKDQNEKVILSKIKDKEAILDSIKKFVGKGK